MYTGTSVNAMRLRQLCGMIPIATAAAMTPVVVRSTQSQLQITFWPRGASAPRTLLRPLTENLDRSLIRLSAATVSKRAAKAAKQDSAGEITAECSLSNAEGKLILSSTPVQQAWADAAWLDIGVLERRPVHFDPPEIEALSLTAAPLIGISLLPFVATLNCDADQCTFVWTRHDDAGESVVVCTARSYIPTDADMDAVLRVRAEPPAPMFTPKLSPQESEAMAASAAAVLGRVAEAVGRVERPPVRRLLSERVAALDAARAGRASSTREGFRLLSYNLMAATYSRHWDEPGSVHSYCSPVLTRSAHRMPRLLDEVRLFDADLVCLQEVDKDWFETLWQPHMGAAGFTGHFAIKRGESSSEGVALFVRSSVFDVLESRVVALDCATNAPPELGALLRAQPLTAEGMRALPTVGQLVLLRSRATGRRLLVANTHLFFANPAVHVRVMQTAHLLWHAREWLAVQASTPTAGDGSSSSSSSIAAAASPTALIVAGDLNSDATDAVLRLLTSGCVGPDDPDWLHGALMWSSSLGLEYDAKRAALSHLNERMSRRSAGGPADAPRPTAAESSVPPPTRTLPSPSSFVVAAELRAVDAVGQRPVALSLPTPALELSGAAEQPPPPVGPAQVSLQGAKELALRFQRLRRAIKCVRLSRDVPREASLHVDGPGAAAAELAWAARLAAEVAAGRTLLDSPVLAAEEISLQLGLPRGAMERDRDAVVEAAAVHLGELGVQLEEAAASLREQVARLSDEFAREHTQSAPPSEKAKEELQARLAKASAGAQLSQPWRLRSAYGLHTQPTHATRAYLNALDWICADAAQLDVLGTAPIPPSEELIRDVAIPSAEFPSDHVSLCCDLAWRTMDEPPDDSSSAQSLAAAAERSFAQISTRQRPSVPLVVNLDGAAANLDAAAAERRACAVAVVRRDEVDEC